VRLVDFRDGKLEVRWTWLPYWIAAGPQFLTEIERTMHDAIIINGMPPNEDSFERVENFLLRLIEGRFRIEGLGDYLRALRFVREA
jgi:hypothetical protein